MRPGYIHAEASDDGWMDGGRTLLFVEMEDSRKKVFSNVHTEERH